MSIDVYKATQDVMNRIAEKFKNLKTLNIIVAGKTGVGKSTFINAVFREKLAETGAGKPVTNHIRRITKEGVPLAIYDTPGFELGKEVQDEVKKEVVEIIIKGLAMHNINQAIHCIWYCISTASNRVEPEEIEWLKELSRENQITQVPIIIVLTQSLSKKNADAIGKILINENFDVIQIIPVLAEDYEIDGREPLRSYGLDELIRVMGEVLPDELKYTLQNVQNVALSEKKRHAQAAVTTATVFAADEGASPIPFSDLAFLIPTQLGMIASITVIFGFKVNRRTMRAFLLSTLAAGGGTLLGEYAVKELLKYIPVLGAVAGGISAATAGFITAALGRAYIRIMERIFKGEMSINDLNTRVEKYTMRKMFRNELRKKE